MNWYSIFYWFSVVDNISHFALAVAILFTLVGFMAFLFKVFTDPDGHYPKGKIVIPRAKSVFRWCVCIAPLAWIMWLLLPTKKQMLMIVAGGTVGNFIQGDSSIRALPADVTKYLHLSMKREIEDLSSETKEELGLATPKDKLLNRAKEMTKEELVNFIKSDTTILK